MTKALGLMLTITGLMLGLWFVQMLLYPGPAPLQVFVVAAMSAAMLSVGIRYILKSGKTKKPKKKKTEEGSPT